MHGENMKLM